MSGTATEPEPVGAAIQDEFELIADRITDELKAPGEADDGESMPLPTDARTIFLGGLFFLAVLAALVCRRRDRAADRARGAAQAPASAVRACARPVARAPWHRRAARDHPAALDLRGFGQRACGTRDLLGRQACECAPDPSGEARFPAKADALDRAIRPSAR